MNSGVEPDPKTVAESIAKEFLLQEHKLFTDFFKEDLAVAGKRVDMFITLSTLLIGIIGTVAGLVRTDQGGYVDYTSLLAVGTFIFLSLLMIGRVILVRIVFRNSRLERWKRRMAIIREKFRILTKDSDLLEDYYPFEADKKKEVEGHAQKWGTGGLVELVMSMNTINLIALLELFLELIREYAGIVEVWWIAPMILIGMFGIALGWFGQKNYSNRLDSKFRKNQ